MGIFTQGAREGQRIDIALDEDADQGKPEGNAYDCDGNDGVAGVDFGGKVSGLNGG